MSRGLPDPIWTDRASICVACGYSLEGLPAPGACPECGSAYDARQLILAGVPNSNSGSSIPRRLAWAAVVVIGVAHTLLWPVQLALNWTVLVAVTAGLAGAVAYLLVTGPRDRGGTERFVVTPAGIWRTPPSANLTETGRGSALVPWEGADGVESKRISAVWRRLRIGHRSGGRLGRVVFDAGIRCPDARVGEVLATIEQCMWRGRAVGGSEPPRHGGAVSGPLPPQGQTVR